MTDAPPKPTKHGAVLIRLLKDRPHGTGAEIGVNHGTTAAQLLGNLPGLHTYYAVDSWAPYPDYQRTLAASKHRDQESFDLACQKFMGRILPYTERVFVLMAISTLAAKAVPDGSLDFVFIDANHSYEYVRADIAAWTPKVRVGGIVAGHDYLARSRAGEEWGVIRAVREAFGAAAHTEPHHVWWVEIADGRRQ